MRKPARSGPTVRGLLPMLLFWGALGLAVTSWYDHKKLDRISPDLLRYVEHAIEGAQKRGAAAAS